VVRSAEEIVALYTERKQSRGKILAAMRDLRDHYNADVIVPLPEMDRSERPAIANLIRSGIDQVSQRVASVQPDVYYPPLRPGQDLSEKRSQTRRRATLGWWEQNNIPIKMRFRARHLIGYASSPVALRYDGDRHIPTWQVRNPLSAYPSPHDRDHITPANIIYGYTRSLGWLAARYPQYLPTFTTGSNSSPDGAIEILEYNDDQETVLLAYAEITPDRNHPFEPAQPSTQRIATLERIPNRAGLCLSVVPGAITLDRPMSAFDGVLGMYQAQAKLMALEMIAVDRATFPDMYLVGRPNETPVFVEGPHDGRTGMVNIVTGGDVRETTAQPNLQTGQIIDRLERNTRVTAGVPAEFGGESPSNVRTGRRGDAVMSAVVDFPVQEAQEMLSASMQEENVRAVALVKAYDPNRPMQFYVSWRGGQGNVNYVPSKDFESDRNIVSYPQSGTDVNGLTVMIGQLAGLGLLSKFGAAMMHPAIADPQEEHERVVAEQLEQALLAGLSAQAQQGTLPPTDLARIATLVRTDKADLFAAVNKAHEEAQARQAPVDNQGQPQGAIPGSPPTQPGIAQPGQGAEQPPQGPVGPPPKSLQNLMGLIQSLHGAQAQGASTDQASQQALAGQS
jgi:hypothetical protein